MFKTRIKLGSLNSSHKSGIVRGKVWVNNHAHIIKPKNEDELQYLYYYFYFLDLNEYVKDGLGRNKLTQGNLRNINIVIPQSDDLKLFVDYAQSCDKLKFEAQEFIKNTQKHAYKKDPLE